MAADPTADGYSLDHARRVGWSSVSGALNRERVELLARAVVGPRVLDAGCGGGAYVDHLAGAGFDAVGVDKYDLFLANARARGYRGRYVQSDLAALPFADGEFDTTVCFDVLEHVDDVAVLGELARVTRRRLIVAVPHEDRRPEHYLLTYMPYLDMTHRRYYSRESLAELAATVGPAAVEVTPECRVPLELLARQELRVGSRFPLVSAVYRGLFRFLLGRARGPDWYVGLAAVIDLAPVGGRG